MGDGRNGPRGAGVQCGGSGDGAGNPLLEETRSGIDTSCSDAVLPYTTDAVAGISPGDASQSTE